MYEVKRMTRQRDVNGIGLLRFKKNNQNYFCFPWNSLKPIVTQFQTTGWFQYLKKFKGINEEYTSYLRKNLAIMTNHIAQLSTSCN